MTEEGLSPYSWSNGPHDRYAAHSHSYNKVIYVVQGSITFGQLAATDFVLGLRRSLAGAVAERWITARQAAAWWAGLEEQDNGGKFFAAMSGIIAGATVR